MILTSPFTFLLTGLAQVQYPLAQWRPFLLSLGSPGRGPL